MLSGHAIGFHGRSESDELLLEDPVSEVGDEEETSGKVIYAASFEELSRNHVQYDTVVWVLISLLLVLACGVGIVMLLYLPVRRYVLQKDIASRRLYITSDEIVYKVTRPSILPLLGLIKVEQRIPLHVVIGIVIEQGYVKIGEQLVGIFTKDLNEVWVDHLCNKLGCLQSIYGVHTFRIECITHGKAAPVGELQFQGVSNPRLLRKVIILEATKRIQEVGNWKLTSFSGDVLSTPTMRSTDVSNSNRWKSPSMKVKASPRHAFSEARGVVSGDLLLHKIEEVKESVQKLGSMLVQSNA
ncbi:uncharacterized protein LOC121989326 [Zingiber officinale]|uniref:uncharacterized protein LOC121989326 n=1 Tax=Zingiber officinale TaxID=94328 RepID=UPI001C4C3B92|nr:uncharacterized protein LOC121989326 [Zingiber officinale]